MLEQVLMFVLGLTALVIGAELLVRGASRLAVSFGVSPLVVGLTVVAFGTSAPELAVSVKGALDGQTDIALGNVVGSNVFNVLFIMGLSALITPLVVNIQLIRQEVPIMIGASLLLLVLGFDSRIGLVDGALLFGLLVAVGLNSLFNIPRSEDPEFHAPIATVIAVYPGADPVDIERLVAGLTQSYLRAAERAEG